MSDQMPSKEPLWSIRSPLVIGVITLCILLGGFGSWTVLSSISGAVVATGQIEVDSNRQIVQHLDGGVVAEILVDEGDIVSEGDVLIRLDPKELASNLLVTENQLFEIMARRARLEAERDGLDTLRFADELLQKATNKPDVLDMVDGQRRLFEARRVSAANEIEQLSKRKTQIADQIQGIQAQQESMRIQLELIDEERNAQQSLLDRGLAQAATVLALRRTEANLKGQLGELIASEAQARGRITETEIEILRLGSQQREDAIQRLRDVRFNELELIETRQALREQINRLDITAPASGIVYGMQVHTPRAVIRPADPVLHLVPQDSPLVISAQVATTDIDQIFINQDVTLRLSALDQRLTPEIFGKISLISADAFRDETSGASFYRVEVSINPGQQELLPEDTVLIPGMPVDSFIRTNDRSPMAYLIKPLADYFSRAFREN